MNGDLEFKMANPMNSENTSGAVGPTVRVTVQYGPNQYELTVPAQSSFGDLKKALAQQSGLEPNKQKILFRGKEKQNNEILNAVGIKDMSKLILLEDSGSKEWKLEQAKKDQEIAKSCEPILRVRAEVDMLVHKVSALETTVNENKKVEEKEFTVLTELLMLQLLKLDGIETEGEVRVQRKNEVRRIQELVEKLDILKTRYTNPFSDRSKSVEQWEAFDSGLVNQIQTQVNNSMQPSTTMTNDWVHFD